MKTAELVIIERAIKGLLNEYNMRVPERLCLKPDIISCLSEHLSQSGLIMRAYLTDSEVWNAESTMAFIKDKK